MTDVICHSDYQSCPALLLLTGSPALPPGINYKELHHTATIICPDMCTSPPLRPSSRYLSQCLSHSKNISDISTQSRADIKMKPSVLPPSPYRQILADWRQVWMIQNSSARVARRSELRRRNNSLAKLFIFIYWRQSI